MIDGVIEKMDEGDRIIASWLRGISIVLHLRHFGVHAELLNGETVFLLDIEPLLSTVIHFVRDWMQSEKNSRSKECNNKSSRGRKNNFRDHICLTF